MKTELLETLGRIRAERRSAVLLSDLASGRQCLLEGGAVTAQGDLEVSPELEAEAVGALRRGISARIEVGGVDYFAHVFEAGLRILIVGAVHIAQPLVRMTKELGHAVTLIDPRDAWATTERFPDLDIDRRWPAQALAALAPDPRTAIVTLTHDPKLDDPALEVALGSSAFYVGALGSRRSHAKRLDRLRALGVEQTQLERIHAPIGLDIGAVSPAEIAVSILAEITEAVAAARKKSGGPR